MKRRPSLAGICAASVCALTAACASIGLSPQAGTALAPAPDDLAVAYEARGSSLGYVVSLGYFSEAEMNDPLWEYARAKNATMVWCRSEARFKRRDVRWVPANDGTGRRCAMAIYTLQCLEPRDTRNEAGPRFSNGLERDRQGLLTEPVAGPKGPNCGQKDPRLITYPKPKE